MSRAIHESAVDAAVSAADPQVVQPGREPTGAAIAAISRLRPKSALSAKPAIVGLDDL
jgi:hypothetical protein